MVEGIRDVSKLVERCRQVVAVSVFVDAVHEHLASSFRNFFGIYLRSSTIHRLVGIVGHLHFYIIFLHFVYFSFWFFCFSFFIAVTVVRTGTVFLLFCLFRSWFSDRLLVFTIAIIRAGTFFLFGFFRSSFWR